VKVDPSQPGTEYVNPALRLDTGAPAAHPATTPLGRLTPSDFPHSFISTVVGSRRSGKSTVCESLLHSMKGRFDTAFLFSATLAGFAGIPNNYKFRDLSLLKSIIARQQGVSEYNVDLQRKRRNGTSKEKYAKSSIVLVFDDMLATGELKNQLLTNLALNGRHLSRGDPVTTNECCVFILSQTVTGVPKKIRLNSDCVISSRIPSREDRKLLVCENLVINSCRGGLADAYACYDQCTLDGDYAMIAMLNHKSNKQRFDQFVRGYKATVAKKPAKLFGTKADWNARLPSFDLTDL
jgi:hypothetical protein